MSTDNDADPESDRARRLDPAVVEKLNELGPSGVERLSPSTATRRKVLGALAAGGVGAGVMGAAAGDHASQPAMSVGDMQLDQAVHIAGKLFGGPGAGRSEVSPDGDAWYLEIDAGTDNDNFRWHYYDGSSWSANGWQSPSASTEDVDIKDNDFVADGDLRYLGSYQANHGDNSDTWTDTNYTFQFYFGTLPWSLINAGDGLYKVVVSAVIRNDTADESVSLRLREIGENNDFGEISRTGTSLREVVSPPEEITWSTDSRIQVYGKASGGTGEVHIQQGLSLHIFQQL